MTDGARHRLPGNGAWPRGLAKRPALRGTLAAALCVLAALSCGATDSGRPTDNWVVSTPAAEGMDAARLDTLVVRLGAGDFGEVHSVLVVRHGRLVLERYFHGWSEEDLHPLYSVTKSVTALLVGMAGAGGASLPLDGRLLDVFPQYLPIANSGSWKDSVTLEDLLTMRAGLRWDEGSTPYGDPANPATLLAQSGNWIRFLLDLPMAEAPGTRFRYNSGCSVLLGAIVAARTGTSAVAFGAQHLFAPLGITRWVWEVGPRGVTNTGWGLSLRSRDLARIGQLVLDRGTWRGRRVMSEDWVRDATAAHVSVTAGFRYGYHWWLLPPSAAGDVVLAWGWGDQFLFVVPLLDLVVVTTGGNYAAASDDQALAFVPQYVFGAVRDADRRLSHRRGAALAMPRTPPQ